MKQKIKSPYFEVDFKERLEQQRTAINAVRFPRLGFRQYRVYDIVEKKDKDASQVLYSLYKLDSKDVDKLFYAASFSVNAADFDTALQYYYELKKLN